MGGEDRRAKGRRPSPELGAVMSYLADLGYREIYPTPPERPLAAEEEGAVDPAARQSAIAESAAAESIAVESAEVESIATGPVAASPATADSPAPGPATANPGSQDLSIPASADSKPSRPEERGEAAIAASPSVRPEGPPVEQPSDPTAPAEPASTEPASTKPASTEPASTGPASTGPASTGPASIGPEKASASESHREYSSPPATAPRPGARDQDSLFGLSGGPDGAEEPPALEIPANPEDRAALLQQVAQEASACVACRLASTRQTVVFGSGHANAELMFIGEGPGANEDRQGLPFVGAAGQLLTKIIQAIDLQREEVYIANMVKCRPPNNRDPEADEVQACGSFLERQIRLVQPRVIVALGRVAAQALLQTKTPLGRLRGRWHQVHGVPVRATYHPAALLRYQKYKRPTWEDMQVVRDALAGKDPEVP